MTLNFSGFFQGNILGSLFLHVLHIKGGYFIFILQTGCRYCVYIYPNQPSTLMLENVIKALVLSIQKSQGTSAQYTYLSLLPPDTKGGVHCQHVAEGTATNYRDQRPLCEVLCGHNHRDWIDCKDTGVQGTLHCDSYESNVNKIANLISR